ncbi:fungal-specific transcription factor domain-containing protein [Penicillium macrosclerotiorum]|uniref:fungal-specific transcription factor domain-containing protein n=1 Tax=Penicillium macrosclerotiorum TaxID=303699 RepID=UPI002546A791|nr:fungal-specific transcription factor domain-containing protein [Penicillium macrosclerotiorum]KAJ5669177.1 fungal-specific transcription factor domain-containing protein [Penicillium macrosclerotiorum]
MQEAQWGLLGDRKAVILHLLTDLDQDKHYRFERCVVRLSFTGDDSAMRSSNNSAPNPPEIPRLIHPPVPAHLKGMDHVKNRSKRATGQLNIEAGPATVGGSLTRSSEYETKTSWNYTSHWDRGESSDYMGHYTRASWCLENLGRDQNDDVSKLYAGMVLNHFSSPVFVSCSVEAKLSSRLRMFERFKSKDRTPTFIEIPMPKALPPTDLTAAVKGLEENIQAKMYRGMAIDRSIAALRNFDRSLPHVHNSKSDTSLNHVQDLVKSVKDIVVEPSRQPRFLGQSGGITLARLVISAIRVDALPSPLLTEPRPYNPSSFSMAAEASLPPRQAADHLVNVYFQYHTPHLPVVERARVEEAIESAYQAMSGQQLPNRAVEEDIFICYMILAIALCDVSNPSGGRPSQSEGCFRSAMSWYEKVVASSKSDVETLRTILLLAQFIALCPSQGSLWNLTDIALRLSIDIGLHWESEDHIANLDPAILYDRRRLWYSTYQFDRILCITLGRPFGIIDESVRVPFPNPWAVDRRTSGSESIELDIHSQRAHNNLFTLSKLESEIKHAQHSQTWAPKLAYPKANYAVWVQDIKPRLEEWYATIPQINRAHPLSIFAHQAYWEYIYRNAILLLYRPNSAGLQTSQEQQFSLSTPLVD